MKNIAIFASGAGTNAKKIIDHFSNSDSVKVALVVCNKPQAGVITIAAAAGIPVLQIEKERFFRGDAYTGELKSWDIDLIVLAGFLWKIPTALINAYPGAIINIHPALLPAYGGKGMYGKFVHQAVLDNKEAKSGITIHYVDEVYDHGAIISQHECDVLTGDTADSLAQRIAKLEHEHYPVVIDRLIHVIKPL